MRPTTQKPLPAVPRPRLNSQNLTTLSIDSQDHLTTLIRRLLSELEGVASSDNIKEAWVESINVGLVELGNSMSRGGWLAGLKRKRRVQKAKRERDVIEFKMLKAKETKEREEMGKLKGKAKGNAPNVDATLKPSSEWTKLEFTSPFEKCQLPHDRRTDKSLALEQIRHITELPTVPAPNPFPKHLLLTVAPPGSRVAVPAEDSGFDLVPANISCVFSSGVYSLPDDPTHEARGGVVLYGLEEWDGLFCHTHI
jgi:1-phosphatidylinositol-3-phosphate 5-kinase